MSSPRVMGVFILQTSSASERLLAVCCTASFGSSSNSSCLKTDERPLMRLDEFNLFVRLEIRTKRFTTSRGVMRLGA